MDRLFRRSYWPGVCVLLGAAFSVTSAQQQQATPATENPINPTTSSVTIEATATPSPVSAISTATPLAVSSATPVSTQDNQAQPAAFESSTVLKATTRLVILDVVATDGQGNHVSDLRASDFTVLEDGKEQTIRAFAFQHPSAQPAVKAQTPNLLPNVFTNVSSIRHASALNVLLLDGLNTTGPNQIYVRQKAIKYLAKMPDQPIAIFTLGTQLRMLQDFTSDPNTLKEAINNYKGSTSVAMDNPNGGDSPEIVPPGVFDGLPQQVQENLQFFETERTGAQMDLRVRMTMDALRAIARALAGYPGRKNLIWLSEAFPLNIFPDADLGTSVFASSRNYNQDVLKAANALMDAEVAVYPVDAAGLETLPMFSAASRGTDTLGRTPALATTISKQASHTAAVHGTMESLAERTGGKAYYNRNDLDNLMRNCIEDGSTYYMIGYYPANKEWNGKFREVHVKANRPGIKLRHRLGYYAVEAQSYTQEDPKIQADELGHALSLDTPISTMITFAAQATPPSEQTKNKVFLTYNIDPHALTFEAGNDGLQHANVECIAQAYSEKGKPIKFNGQTVTAAMKPETFRRVLQQGFPCNHDLELPGGKYLLRLAVRDDRTGLIGTANARITVP